MDPARSTLRITISGPGDSCWRKKGTRLRTSSGPCPIPKAPAQSSHPVPWVDLDLNWDNLEAQNTIPTASKQRSQAAGRPGRSPESLLFSSGVWKYKESFWGLCLPSGWQMGKAQAQSGSGTGPGLNVMAFLQWSVNSKETGEGWVQVVRISVSLRLLLFTH